MNFKKVKYLLPATDINMGGILLKQALPTQQVNQVDPFLLLHHADFSYNEYAPAIQQGIGPHPHRGFTPVTFVINGEVHHRDSRANNQIAKAGEVQWMHAGRGIIHSERPSQALVDRKGNQEIIQLWINSPAKSKMNQAHYQYFQEKDIPVFYSNDKNISNKLIAGTYQNLRGKIKTESELLIIWGKANTASSQQLVIPQHYNSMLYLIKGEMKLTGYGMIEKEQLVVFEEAEPVQPHMGGGMIEMSVSEDVQFLLLCGKAINEELTMHGPFVMNTQTQIMEAMRDYQMGKMGILIEDR